MLYIKLSTCDVDTQTTSFNQNCCPGVFIIKFEHCFNVSIFNIEQVGASWAYHH